MLFGGNLGIIPTVRRLIQFAYPSLPVALLIARLGTAGFFLAHAVVRIFNGSIVRFGAFMESIGFPNGLTTVWIITTAEIIASVMLIFGFAVRLGTFILFSIAGVGIILIHRHAGWFVGEHGTGGSEYSVALMVLLVLVASADADAKKRKNDRHNSTDAQP